MNDLTAVVPEQQGAPQGEVVWSPDQEQVTGCALWRFMRQMEERLRRPLPDYRDLHRWSVEDPQFFWPELLRFLDIRCCGAVEPAYDDRPGVTPLAREWFPNLSLSFCENILRAPPEREAVISHTEERVRRSLTFGELKGAAARLASYLHAGGIGRDDRVFGYLPAIPEAVVAMVASAARGATWSSCGTDYQEEGVLARVARVRPRVLVAAVSYLWRGEVRDLLPTIEQVVRRTPSIEQVVLVEYVHAGQGVPDGAARAHALQSVRSNLHVVFYSQLIDASVGDAAVDAQMLFGEKFTFSHPLYILFSSGTTGVPKGIVHSVGGTLLEHKKELMLHSDVRPGDRVFYQTSTSWMMWSWLVSALACEATVVLYDGDPMLADGLVLWRIAAQERLSHFGTSAAYLAALERRGAAPGSHYDLSALRTVLSTGSTLHPWQYDYILKQIKPLWIQSISGGTDILGCFGLGCPLLPVWRGEVQCKSLGYAVEVFDPAKGEVGAPISATSGGERVAAQPGVVGQQGELVCVRPAPSMPIRFLDDPDGAAYRAAYFEDIPGVWRHGDFVSETASGGLVFRGRSDATLKPGGVRVATADLYAALGSVAALEQALAVGYTPAGDGVERIVLFVVLAGGAVLTAAVEDEIRNTLKRSNSFYVPALILAAPDVPRTANNKLAELLVKRILAGDPGPAGHAIANPDTLTFFQSVAAPEVRRRLG